MSYTNGLDNPELYFNTVQYTGNKPTGQSVTGVGFQPDWYWSKNTPNTGYNHSLIDSVRGVSKILSSNNNNAELTSTDSLTSFDSDGFTLGADANGYVNQQPDNHVAWCWKAGGTASSNSDGSITSSVSASTTAGFSIVSYTGNGSTGSTVGHGLGQTPAWILVKNRDQTDKWAVFHQSTPNGANSYLELDQTGASSNLSLSPPYWGTPSSTTFGGLHFDSTNGSGEKYIAYCFAEKKGYSKFGGYTGNGNADGTFVYTGFKPSWLMYKRTDSAHGWFMLDNKRDTFNVSYKMLRAESSGAEDTGSSPVVDFLSNGFKMRNAYTSANASGGTYIYMAFAESPFTNSNGVPTNAR